MSIKQPLKCKIPIFKMRFFRARIHGRFSTCRIERKCLARNVFMDSLNHIEANSCVFSTRIGYGFGISRDSLIDAREIGRYSTLVSDVKIVMGQYPTKRIASIYPAFYSARGLNGIHICKSNNH